MDQGVRLLCLETRRQSQASLVHAADHRYHSGYNNVELANYSEHSKQTSTCTFCSVVNIIIIILVLTDHSDEMVVLVCIMMHIQ